MAWDQSQFDAALKRKYEIQGQQANIQGQQADADTTRAEAAAQDVAQRPALQAAADAAAMQRAQLDNQTRMGVAGQNFALGQAQLGLEGVKAASDDLIKRATLTKQQNVYDPVTGEHSTIPGVDFVKDAPKFGTSALQSYLENAPTAILGPSQKSPESSGGYGLYDPTKNKELPGYAEGGLAPVNKPFIVGERGPELFIPGDGSDPMVVGENGPTVMTVPRRGTVVPHETVRQAAEAGYGLPEGPPRSDPQAFAGGYGLPRAPWANVKPSQNSPRMSPDGLILPQEPSSAEQSGQAQQSRGYGLPEGRPRQVAQPGYGQPEGRPVPGTSGTELRYVNIGQIWRQQQEADRQALLAQEREKPEFTPQGAIDYMGNLNEKDQQKFLAGLTGEQYDALKNYRLQQSYMRTTPARFMPNSMPGGVEEPEPTRAQRLARDGYTSEYDDGTVIVRPKGEVTTDPKAVRQGQTLFGLIPSQEERKRRWQEVDKENATMQAQRLEQAKRLLGLGSYLVTAPDTAVFRDGK